MRVLVTGGFGYLGSHVSNYFLHRGYKVRILSRSSHLDLSDWSQHFEIIIGDVSEYSSIKNCCKSVDIVIHTAALNEVECQAKSREALLVNGYGTNNLLEDAFKNNVKRLIYFSTFHVYGQPKTKIITEETPPAPLTDYAISHYLAELYCRKFDAEQKVKSYILRISNGYGAPLFKTINRWTLVINQLCQMAFNQKKIALRSKGTQERDFIAITDILRGVQIFADKEVDQNCDNVYNLGGENSLSIISVANTIAKVYEERYNESIPIEVPEDVAEPDIAIPFMFSIDKIKRLGYHPVAIMKDEIHKIFELLERG